MSLVIEAVNPKTVKIHGQQMTRDYAEMVLLPLLVTGAGKNEAAIFKVAEKFATAGLSLTACHEADRVYRSVTAERKAERERQLREAEWNAQRCYVPTPEEIARAKAERQRKAEEIRAHGATIRAYKGAH